MSKLSQLISFAISVFLFLLLNLSVSGQDKYDLNIKAVDKDSAFLNTIGLQNSFNSRAACAEYVNKLSSFLQSIVYSMIHYLPRQLSFLVSPIIGHSLALTA